MNTNTTRNIFIVDDDAHCLHMYEQHLSNMGFQTIKTFSSGKHFLENLQLNPDLIFLDYHLQDCKGLQLLQTIKEYNKNICVVFISGQSDMEITIQVLNSGAFDYIIKDNLEIEKISTVIGKWLAACEYSKKLFNGENINPDEKILKIIVDAQEKVRHEISNELHDNVCQLLVASKLYIEIAQKDEQNRLELMHESTIHINTAIQEVRKLSHSLHSVYLHSIDFETELRNLIESLKKQEKIKISAKINIEGIAGVLPTEAQHDVFRILQEQVNNIIKYSEAKNVYIELVLVEKELRIKVSDNGIGFNPEEAKSGIGLTNMYNRISSLNGTYLLKTKPGEGCCWNIRIPLRFPVNFLTAEAI